MERLRCRECKNTYCGNSGTGKTVAACSGYKKEKTRTNYDLFHEMKPYELADFLAQVMDYCFNSGRCGECDEECPMYDCCNTCGVDNVEDWLMQKVKNEKHL